MVQDLADGDLWVSVSDVDGDLVDVQCKCCNLMPCGYPWSMLWPEIMLMFIGCAAGGNLMWVDFAAI